MRSTLVSGAVPTVFTLFFVLFSNIYFGPDLYFYTDKNVRSVGQIMS